MALESAAKELAEEAYQQYAKTIYRFCLFKTNSYHDAEDLTTEVFAKLLSGKANGVAQDKLIGWLIRVAENECKMLFRKTGIRKERFAAGTIDEASIDCSNHDRPWLSIEIYQAINKLKRFSRQIFFLKAVEGYTFKEIATTLKISEGAAKMSFYRSVKFLKKQLSGEV